MFEVLVFGYENYWHGASCPEPAALAQKLSAVGLDAQETQEALSWLREIVLARATTAHSGWRINPAAAPGWLRA